MKIYFLLLPFFMKVALLKNVPIRHGFKLLNLDFDCNGFEIYLRNHLGEVDYRILTITNPNTLQCEPRQVEIYDERRIWEKAMCVVKDDLFAKKTFYNRLMGIKRNANMTLDKFNLTIDSVDDQLDKGERSLIPISYPTFSDYNRMSKSNNLFNHLIERSQEAWHLFEDGEIIDLTKLVFNEIGFISDKIGLTGTQSTSKISSTVLALTILNGQCDTLSDNTTYITNAADKLLDGILNFGKTTLDETFWNNDFIKAELEKLSQELVEDGMQIDVKPSDYFKNRIGVARSLDKTMKMVASLFVPVVDLGSDLTPQFPTDQFQVANMFADLKQQFGVSEDTWELCQASIDVTSYSIFGIVFFFVKKLFSRQNDYEKEIEDHKEALEDLSKEIESLKSAIKSLNEAKIEAMKITA